MKKLVASEPLVEEAVQALAEATREFCRDVHGNTVRAFPVEEPVEFESPEAGVLTVSAKTSTAGPGYHAWLCEALDSVAARLGLAWEPESDDFFDETGYFATRDVQSLYGQMNDFRKALMATVHDHLKSQAAGGAMALSMPIGRTFFSDQPVHTNLGPRGADWVEAMAAGGGDPEEFWPWYKVGVGAGGRRGLALSLIWTEVRWRKPVTDEETELLRRVESLLRATYPERTDLPWREWQEIRGYLDESDELDAVIARNAQAQTGSLIGYRRRGVAVSHSGWTIRVPGSFAQGWTEEGALQLYENDLWIGLSFYTSRNGTLPELKRSELVDHPKCGAARLALTSDSESDLLQSMLLRETKLLVVTMSGDPGTLDRMKGIWASISPP